MGDGSPAGRRRNYMTCMALAALAVAGVATVRFSTNPDAAWATVAHGESIEYSSTRKRAGNGDFNRRTTTSEAIDRASQQRSQLQQPHSVAGSSVSNALLASSRGARGGSGSAAASPLCPECNCTEAAVDAATAAAADAHGTAAEAVSAASAASASAAADTAAEVQKEDCSKAVSDAVTRAANSTSTATQESISTAVAAATTRLKRQLSSAKKVDLQPYTASACNFETAMRDAQQSTACSL